VYDSFTKKARMLHCVLLKSVADLPARALVQQMYLLLVCLHFLFLFPQIQKMKGHNGTYGCCCCLCRGSKENNTMVYVNNPHQQPRERSNADFADWDGKPVRYLRTKEKLLITINSSAMDAKAFLL
jgi:hypothetical protein